MNGIEKYNEKIFEEIKHSDEEGNEYWLARELQVALEYKEWRKFNSVIKKAMISCDSSNYNTFEHFVGADKTIKMPKGASKIINDYKLSRYACYLIVQNGDSRKKVVALGQTYFAVQTRKQELIENDFKNLPEDEKRLLVRKRVKDSNFGLNHTAINCGVKDLSKFHNAGYKGLYNGETADDIAKRKGLRYREDILDNMGSSELITNLFRIDQTDAKLKRDNISNEFDANNIHYNVGKDIRDFIKKQGGEMPEDLPTPKKSIKEIEKNKKIVN